MRALFLCCLSLSFYFLSAQSLINSKTIGWSGSQIKLQTIHDKSGALHASLLENADGFKVTLYDRAFTETHEYNISRLNQEELTAGFIKDGKIYLPDQDQGKRAYRLKSWSLYEFLRGIQCVILTRRSELGRLTSKPP